MEPTTKNLYQWPKLDDTLPYDLNKIEQKIPEPVPVPRTTINTQFMCLI